MRAESPAGRDSARRGNIRPGIASRAVGPASLPPVIHVQDGVNGTDSFSFSQRPVRCGQFPGRRIARQTMNDHAGREQRQRSGRQQRVFILLQRDIVPCFPVCFQVSSPADIQPVQLDS